MAQKSYFFDSVDHDRIYSAADFARVFGAIAGRDGVIYGYGDELAVSPGSGMAVKVGTGAAFVQGRMLEVYDQAETLPVTAAHATNPRIDRVVMRVDLSTAQRRAYLAVKTGTPAATPAAPLLQQDSTVWEMGLAQVRVPAGATGIVAEDITDERAFTSSAATTLYTPGIAGFDAATVQAGLDILAGSRIVDHNLDVADPENGYYMRGEDGWQVCWNESHDFQSGTVSTSMLQGLTVYRLSAPRAWSFPAPFRDTTYAVTAVYSYLSSGIPGNLLWGARVFEKKALAAGVQPWTLEEIDGATAAPHMLIAIGPWK